MDIDEMSANSGRYLDENDTVHNVVEKTTGAFKVVQTEHAYIHDGLGFSTFHKATIAAGQNFIIGLTTPADKAIHFSPFTIATTADKVTVTVNEDTTFTGGTALTVHNHNRMLAITPSVAFVTAPTVTLAGNPFAEVFVGGGTGTGQIRSGGNSSGNFEYVLKPNTKYTITINNGSTASNIVHINMFWYEE